MGDFSSLQDIPDMYRYCKSTEKSDMTLFGFVTGHLLNLDGMSDKHDRHDTQKPHTTPPKHHQHAKVFCVLAFNIQPGSKSLLQVKRADHYSSGYYLSDYVPDIFHPPTV